MDHKTKPNSRIYIGSTPEIKWFKKAVNKRTDKGVLGKYKPKKKKKKHPTGFDLLMRKGRIQAAKQ